jgi:hypothetical protein
MADLSSILSDPNYVNANAETKAAIFDKFSAQDKNFTGANSETQQAIRVKFGLADMAPAQTGTGMPGPRKAPTMGELALSAPPARLLMGAVAPLVGAVQFGANVGDYLNEKMGQKPVVSKAIADWWNSLQTTKERGMAFGEAPGIKPVDVLGGVGTLMTAAAQPSTAVTTGKQILEGMKQGAVVGTALPGTTKISDQAIGGALGTTLGGAAPILIPAAAKALGWMWDATGGRLIQVKAGKIMREIAGDDLAAIQAANASAAPGLTSAQAVQEAGILNPVLQAMGQRAPTSNIASAKAVKEAADVAGRVNQLEAVTPDLAKSLDVRELAAKANYGGARAADELRLAALALKEQESRALAGTAGPTFEAQITPQLQALKGNPVISAAEKTAKDLAATQGINLGKDPMSTLQGLHYMKMAIDAQFKSPTASTALQNYSTAALQNTKTQLLSAINEISPQYTGARMLYSRLSEPVNQAQVLNKMTETLKGSGAAAEKPAQFLNALGQGESALIKRADQNPRFGGVSEILTPEQMAAVNKVSGELKREATMAQLAKDGAEALAGILKERAVTAPGVNATSAVINKVSGILRGRVNDKTLEAVANGMMSGKSANELLATLPAVERNAVLKALAESKVTGAEAGAAVNAMAPRRKNQNALAQ